MGRLPKTRPQGNVSGGDPAASPIVREIQMSVAALIYGGTLEVDYAQLHRDDVRMLQLFEITIRELDQLGVGSCVESDLLVFC